MKIKSQESKNNIIFIFKYFFNAIYIKPFLLFGTAFFLILFLCLSMIYYGAFLQKNQTVGNIQQIIFDAAETKLSVFGNYFKGLLSTPDKVFIDIEFEKLQLLNYARQNAMSRGYISDKDQEITVKAQLSIDSKTYNVELSPTGLNLDMIGNYDKRAYKVKVLDGKKIYGMQEFKLLPPKSRGYIVEWIGHEFEKK